MICLVRDKKIPFAGFPIDVKNVDVIFDLLSRKHELPAAVL